MIIGREGFLTHFVKTVLSMIFDVAQHKAAETDKITHIFIYSIKKPPIRQLTENRREIGAPLPVRNFSEGGPRLDDVRICLIKFLIVEES